MDETAVFVISTKGEKKENNRGFSVGCEIMMCQPSTS